MTAAKELCAKLGYTFKNKSLLEDALSHRSYHAKNNERLEFLGDSVLNFVVAAELYRRFPQSREGELSRLRASLVREETLALLAQEFSLGQFIRLGVGELKSGGAQRTSILADAIEAVIGAIYLDGGMAKCEERILSWYENRFSEERLTDELKDPKTCLQEYLQSQKLALPTYSIVEIEGAAHAQTFRVSCEISELNKMAVGEGSSRRKAEQEAAKKILEMLDYDTK